MTDVITLIQPSRDTISKRIKTDCLKLSKAHILSWSEAGLLQTLGAKKLSELSIGEVTNSPTQSLIPVEVESLQEYSKSANMLSLNVSA